jgi:hypothetical protein
MHPGERRNARIVKISSHTAVIAEGDYRDVRGKRPFVGPMRADNSLPLSAAPGTLGSASLERRNSLRTAIFAGQELTGNLLYELTVARKMDYHWAWEIATRECG